MGTVPLTPLLAGLDPHRYGDGSRPLPRRRLERAAQLTASEEWTIAGTATALRVSPSSVKRLRAHPVIAARVQYLRRQAAERAARDEPLALQGNRIRLLGALARDLRQHLLDHAYTTTIGVTKQGQPIEGFDRGRVSELIKTVALLDEMAEGKQAKSSTDALAVAVTMTTEQAVTRVQALLSRTAPPDEGGGHP